MREPFPLRGSSGERLRQKNSGAGSATGSFQNPLRLGRKQNQDRLAGRFFQRFQEGIGGLTLSRSAEMIATLYRPRWFELDSRITRVFARR